jgi:hypothetical protein
MPVDNYLWGCKSFITFAMKFNKSSRKCPACGQWSGWNQHPDDLCEHCQAILDPQGLKARQERENEEFRQKGILNLTLIEIFSYDSAFTRFYKRIIQGFQLTFFAILSFIIWVVTMLAG